MFHRGDIVRVNYTSPRLLDEWLNGYRPIGPGDIGIVKYATGETGSQFVADVTVEFPMIGCYGVHSCNLVLVGRVGGSDADAR
jgi:hypothetical protein